MPPLNERQNGDHQKNDRQNVKRQNDHNHQLPSNGSYRPNDIRLWLNWTTRDQIMTNLNQFTAVLSGKKVSDDCKGKMFRRNNNTITTLIGLQSANEATQMDQTDEASPRKRRKLTHDGAKRNEQTPVFEITFNLRTKLIDHLNANLNATVLVDELETISNETKSELIKQNNNINHQLLGLPVRIIEVGREGQPTAGRPSENASIVFCFVGYSPQEKQTFTVELAKIGIKVCQDGHEFDYLITNKKRLIKTALLFVSIAKGRWICHPDFYYQTLKLGAPPDPEQYEWGSNEQHLNQLEPRLVPLAKACRYWRLKVAETGQFAFHDQSHVVVSMSADNYASILQNGGGLVAAVDLESESKESYASALTKLYEMLKDGTLYVQYVLINVKRRDRARLCDLATIQRIEEDLKVKCLAIDYLSLYLVHPDQLDLDRLLLNPKN